MLILWLVVVTIISIAALAVSVTAWSRLPRQSAPPPAYPPQYTQPAAAAQPVWCGVVATYPQSGPPTPKPPAMAWEPRSRCVDATD